MTPPDVLAAAYAERYRIPRPLTPVQLSAPVRQAHRATADEIREMAGNGWTAEQIAKLTRQTLARVERVLRGQRRDNLGDG